jgi:hypothetical protein
MRARMYARVFRISYCHVRHLSLSASFPICKDNKKNKVLQEKRHLILGVGEKFSIMLA